MIIRPYQCCNNNEEDRNKSEIAGAGTLRLEFLLSLNLFVFKDVFLFKLLLLSSWSDFLFYTFISGHQFFFWLLERFCFYFSYFFNFLIFFFRLLLHLLFHDIFLFFRFFSFYFLFWLFNFLLLYYWISYFFLFCQFFIEFCFSLSSFFY